MRGKSVMSEAHDINLAIRLVRLGARIQVLEVETSLSRERLVRLYKELRGISPPKGMLPFSDDWFMGPQANVHASLYYGLHQFLVSNAKLQGIEAVAQAYRLYLHETGAASPDAAVLSFTRAWTLVRFIDGKVLTTTTCQHCRCKFVTRPYDLHNNFTCSLCQETARHAKSSRQSATRTEVTAQS